MGKGDLTFGGKEAEKFMMMMALLCFATVCYRYWDGCRSRLLPRSRSTILGSVGVSVRGNTFIQLLMSVVQLNWLGAMPSYAMAM